MDVTLATLYWNIHIYCHVYFFTSTFYILAYMYTCIQAKVIVKSVFSLYIFHLYSYRQSNFYKYSTGQKLIHCYIYIISHIQINVHINWYIFKIIYHVFRFAQFEFVHVSPLQQDGWMPLLHVFNVFKFTQYIYLNLSFYNVHVSPLQQDGWMALLHVFNLF